MISQLHQISIDIELGNPIGLQAVDIFPGRCSLVVLKRSEWICIRTREPDGAVYLAAKLNGAPLDDHVCVETVFGHDLGPGLAKLRGVSALKDGVYGLTKQGLDAVGGIFGKGFVVLAYERGDLGGVDELGDSNVTGAGVVGVVGDGLDDGVRQVEFVGDFHSCPVEKKNALARKGVGMPGHMKGPSPNRKKRSYSIPFRPCLAVILLSTHTYAGDSSLMEITQKEAAYLLRRAPSTLKSWRAQRRGPPWYKRGYDVVYIKEEVERWISDSLVRQHTSEPHGSLFYVSAANGSDIPHTPLMEAKPGYAASVLRMSNRR